MLTEVWYCLIEIQQAAEMSHWMKWNLYLHSQSCNNQDFPRKENTVSGTLQSKGCKAMLTVFGQNKRKNTYNVLWSPHRFWFVAKVASCETTVYCEY